MNLIKISRKLLFQNKIEESRIMAESKYANNKKLAYIAGLVAKSKYCVSTAFKDFWKDYLKTKDIKQKQRQNINLNL